MRDEYVPYVHWIVLQFDVTLYLVKKATGEVLMIIGKQKTHLGHFTKECLLDWEARRTIIDTILDEHVNFPDKLLQALRTKDPILLILTNLLPRFYNPWVVAKSLLSVRWKGALGIEIQKRYTEIANLKNPPLVFEVLLAGKSWSVRVNNRKKHQNKVVTLMPTDRPYMMERRRVNRGSKTMDILKYVTHQNEFARR